LKRPQQTNALRKNSTGYFLRFLAKTPTMLQSECTKMPLREPLPPYLHRTDPMELEDIPLQTALLTMELVQQRAVISDLLDWRDERIARDREKVDAMIGCGNEWIEACPLNAAMSGRKLNG
jgi:hypothetical protein